MNRRGAERDSGRLSRRRFLGLAGAAGALGTAVYGADALGAAPPAAEAFAPRGITRAAVDFHGVHQAGIVTPVQERLLFASFDVITDDRAELVGVLQEWTSAARKMAAGLPVGSDNTDQDAPPDDTGEAAGLGPASLTLTFGFGASLFDRAGDPFRIAARKPAALVPMPVFAGDELVASLSDGDIAVQACADDPQVTFHAIRNLARTGRGVVALRWSQSGFGRTSKTDAEQVTPRNLMGFKDGTNNLVVEDTAGVDEHVWVGRGDDPAWMRGGTYLVTRRIRMLLEVWDRSTLADQEQTIGRVKASGAPLGSHREHDAVPLEAKAGGEPVIARDAHIRLAAPSLNDGIRLLRRGYSFTDGIDPVTNQLDSGLFFVAYQRDPRKGFIPVQRHLATDALNEYIRHTSTAMFACPPGVEGGGFVGETLFS